MNFSVGGEQSSYTNEKKQNNSVLLSCINFVIIYKLVQKVIK